MSSGNWKRFDWLRARAPKPLGCACAFESIKFVNGRTIVRFTQSRGRELDKEVLELAASRHLS